MENISQTPRKDMYTSDVSRKSNTQIKARGRKNQSQVNISKYFIKKITHSLQVPSFIKYEYEI